MPAVCKDDGFVKGPISALRESFVTAAYAKVRLIPQDPQALISGLLRIRPNSNFLRMYRG
ncbi:hypothetical protein DESC_880092 [Desulfosarcina cetonica]|nr:hypothetical protein DESC_880092 [Desulfosarcina cetonica]